jgi:hypothetical protein
MGYEDQLKEAERILDKMNAARQPNREVQKRLDELETIVTWLAVFSELGWLMLLIHVF